MEYLNLASGASHFSAPEAAVTQAIEAINKHQTGYGNTEGLPILRNAIAKRYLEDYNVTIPSENILVTNGAKQALFNLLFVLLKPGDEVIIPQPSWFAFPEMLELLQIKPVYLETFAEENYTIDPEKLESLITEKSRLFILSNPNNPTGRIYNKTEISAFLNVLQKYPEIRILSDEIYDLVIYDNLQIPTILQFPEVQHKAILVNGFSKNFAMSAWRVGYLIGPFEIIKKCIHFQQTIISGVNLFVQEGCVATLENRKDFMEKSMKILSENRKILAEWLNLHLKIPASIPEGGYYFFADFRKVIASEFIKQQGISNSQQFFDFLKKNYNLELHAGDRFEKPGFARITFAVPPEILTESLKRLDLLLKDCQLQVSSLA